MDIKKLVKNFQQTNALSSETMPSIEPTPMNADWVWEQMTDIWGEQWMRERGEQPSNMWVTQLSSITNDHLQRGVNRTVSERLNWPPSLPQFLSLCLDFDTTEAFNRMINRKAALDDVEYYTRQAVGYQCKRVLDDTKARNLFNKVFKDKLELKRKGKLPIRDQKLLAAESIVTETDKVISARTGCKTDIEKRMAKIIKNRVK